MASIPPPLPPGERLRRVGVAAWSIIGILILAAIAAWLLYRIRVIFPPLVLALLLIYLLNPPISRLERRGVRRGLAAVLVFMVAIAIIVLIGIATFPFVSDQASHFAEEWPEFRTELVTFVEDTSKNIEDRFGITISTEEVSCLLGEEVEGANCDEITSRFREEITSRAGAIGDVGRSVLEVLLIFVLAPLLALYLLIDLPQLQRDLLQLFPETHRAEAADLGSKVGRAVGGFFRGQFLVALSVGVLSAIGFKIIGLPFWLLIGAIAGLFNLLPLVGPYIGGAIGFLIGTVSAGVGLGLKAALVELIVQQIDNHLISPQIMKRSVQIHPATVVLALLAGGTIAGFWGVLLGVPTVAVGKILLGHLWTTRVLGESATPYRSSTADRAPPATVPARSEPQAGPGEPAGPETGEAGEESEEPPEASEAAEESEELREGGPPKSS